METIATFISRVLVERENSEDVLEDVTGFRQPYQTLYYCFDNGRPA